MKYQPLFLITLSMTVCSNSAWAEENGSGTYTPGSIASRIDSMLPAPGWIVRTNYYQYSGENRIGCLEANCANRANVKANVNALSLTVGWRPDIDLGARYSYMVSIAVPYLWADIASTVTPHGSGASSRFSGTNQGVGDTEFIPVNVSYHVDDKNDLNFKLIGRVPTGEFKATQLANLGKNYWSVEPTVSYLYFDKQTSLDGAIYTGVNFNTTNHDTSFHSGSQLHIDYTLQKNFAYGNDQIGFGIAGYTYRQIADDSGRGVIFPSQRARLSGIGPVVSYTGALWGKPSVTELKWTHDYEVANRFGGDTVLLKTGLIF